MAQMYFFANKDGTQTQKASFTSHHREIVFEVELTDVNAGVDMRVLLPLHTNLDMEFLTSLAKRAIDEDYFDGLYLAKEGGDPDYAYTFSELFPDAEFSLEGDTLRIHGLLDVDHEAKDDVEPQAPMKIQRPRMKG